MAVIRVKPRWELWEWQSEAACKGMDSSIFFSPPGERGNARRERERLAQQVCGGCPVKARCASFATACQESYGIWGGLTERDRGFAPDRT
ncbi:WhiB family transcriptional regulator [Streptacidiphilus monticola]|uniref:Transcriptional regulator WhiB n=1 Tax=Streptacidiphilus monticola TaxID=2161674 RepID=A0ABW1GBR5_9ACTN